MNRDTESSCVGNNQNNTLNPVFNFEVTGAIDRNTMDQIAKYTFNKINSGFSQMGIKLGYPPNYEGYFLL